VKTVASTNQGIEDLDAAIGTHFEHLKRHPASSIRRTPRARAHPASRPMLKEKFMDRLIGNTIPRADYGATP